MTSAESIAEGAALAWLEGLGCAVLHGPDIAPGKLLVRNAKRIMRRRS